MPRWIEEEREGRRWSLSAYSIFRPDSGRPGLVPEGQLGGSQAGIRFQRLLIEKGNRLSLSFNLRASTPLRDGQGKEAGVGLSIRRNGRVPVELLVERRIAVDGGGRNAVAILGATGFDDFRLPGKMLLSGYAQAGAVGFKRRDGFVDGALRAEREAGALGGLRLRIGGVAAGALQPGLSRLDLGPSAAVRFRIGKAGVRLGGEWRYRVSGKAEPGSGPALTLGLDY